MQLTQAQILDIARDIAREQRNEVAPECLRASYEGTHELNFHGYAAFFARYEIAAIDEVDLFAEPIDVVYRQISFYNGINQATFLRSESTGSSFSQAEWANIESQWQAAKQTELAAVEASKS